MKLYQYIITLVLIIISTQTYAFDKKRSGFFTRRWHWIA